MHMNQNDGLLLLDAVGDGTTCCLPIKSFDEVCKCVTNCGHICVADDMGLVLRVLLHVRCNSAGWLVRIGETSSNEPQVMNATADTNRMLLAEGSFCRLETIFEAKGLLLCGS